MKLPIAIASLLALATPAAAAAVGPDAPRCKSGGPALIVSVQGLKARAGTLRVQLYGANPADFLAKGKKLRRIEVPVSATAMDVCVALPQPGRYAVAVRHDANGDKKKRDWNDGGGFSRNPRVTLIKLQPRHNQVAFNVGPGVHRIPVVMQYRRGVSIGPVGQGG